MDADELSLLERLKGRTVMDFRVSGGSVSLKLDDGTGIWFGASGERDALMVGEGAADDPG